MAQFCHKDSLSLFTHFCVETNLWYASKYKSSRTDFNLPGLKQDLIRVHLQQQQLSESWLNLVHNIFLFLKTFVHNIKSTRKILPS